jgi:hypothetical protein
VLAIGMWTLCTRCYERESRYLIHPREPDPHVYCGECIERVLLRSLDTGKPALCLSGCGREFKLSDLQNPGFGRAGRSGPLGTLGDPYTARTGISK